MPTVTGDAGGLDGDEHLQRRLARSRPVPEIPTTPSITVRCRRRPVHRPPARRATPLPPVRGSGLSRIADADAPRRPEERLSHASPCCHRSRRPHRHLTRAPVLRTDGQAIAVASRGGGTAHQRSVGQGAASRAPRPSGSAWREVVPHHREDGTPAQRPKGAHVTRRDGPRQVAWLYPSRSRARPPRRRTPAARHRGQQRLEKR